MRVLKSVLVVAVLACFSACGRGVFVHQAMTAATKPWVGPELGHGARGFDFIVVSDRSGGCRAGVFESAMRKVADLQPDFVINVGDLIAGYTQDKTQIADQWEEVLVSIKEMNLPFFLVPGNHDLSNAMQLQYWKERFGPTHYWFMYQDVLFVVLDSQDGSAPGEAAGKTGLSARQVADVKDVLAGHKDVRWTFVLMHQPLWLQEEGGIKTARKNIKEGSPTGFGEIMRSLAGRPHTVFTGHYHNYVKYRRQGADYYVLGTTGGSSPLRGAEWGEFDHVTRVSMTDAGPRIVHLSLDGIHAGSVRTELDLKGQMALAAEIQALRVKLDEPLAGLSKEISLTVTNPFPDPLVLSVDWSFPPGCPWTAQSAAGTASNGPGTLATINLRLDPVPDGPRTPYPVPVALVSVERAGRPTMLNRVPMGRLFDVTSYLKEHRPELVCAPLAAPPVIDGILAGDKAWAHEPAVQRMLRNDLTGASAVPAGMWVRYDAQNLYVTARCVETNSGGMVLSAVQRDGDVWDDDGIEVFIDSTMSQRDYYQIIVNAAGTIYDGIGKDPAWNGEFASAVGKEEGAWTVELAIPWTTLGLAGPPAKGSCIGFNVQRNRPQNKETTQWAPTPGGSHQPALFGRLRF